MKLLNKINNHKIQLSLILFMGTLLRVYGVLNFPLIFDEAHNVLLTKGDNLSLMIKGAADAHPPAYHIVWHYWQTISENLVFLRMLSLVFGVMTIYAIYKVGRKLFNRKMGLLSAYLIAISPAMIYYSSVARMYSLAILISTLVTYFFFKYLKKEKGLVSLGLLLLMGLYTHFFFIIFILMLNLYLFLNLKKYRSRLKNWVKLTVILVLIYLPMVYLLITVSRSFAIPGTNILKLPLFYTTAVIPWEAVQTLSVFRYRFIDLTSLYALVLSASALIIVLSSIRHTRKVKSLALLTFLYISTPFVIFIISYFIFSISALRSFIIFSPVFFLISAGVLSKFNKNTKNLGIFAYTIFIMLFFVNFHSHYLGKNNELSRLYRQFKNNDNVIYNDPILYLPSKILNPPGKHYLVSPGHLEQISYDALQVEVVNIDSVPKKSRIWYVRQETNWPPYELKANEIESYLLKDLKEEMNIPFYRFNLILYR